LRQLGGSQDLQNWPAVESGIFSLQAEETGFRPLWILLPEVVSASTDRFSNSAGEPSESNTIQR
jgi:hypothetical protein